ncbi:hypothetical protein GJ631_14860 [Natronomonas sp. CBA1123]|uniref:hypothetical protein n=1 Tax=Natronomonas sp. CBA1123 TaxID=2668070 RepID=UPI0012EA608F|nr:hypothetical protein [Natronomonas sp. CBA1123]MUV87796.1 hypothetical protein [Natronomonas sp. CBA1123]
MSEITHLSQYATQQQNTTGELTPILTFSPEDGTAEQIRHAVNKGDESGVPIYFDLRDGSGNPLPNDTEVLLRVDVPSKEQPVVVSERLKNIAAWNALDMREQRNEENIDAVKVDLKGKVINVRYFDSLRVDVVSSEQVDWSNSELYVDGKATRTVSYEGE